MAATDDALLVKNTLWMLAGQAAKLLIQALYFVVMARYLGPVQYGSFIAVTAAAAIASPFVGNGTGSLMIKNVARRRDLLPEYLGTALMVTGTMGIAISGIVIGACSLALPGAISTTIILLVVITDVLVYRFVDVASWAFQAVEQLSWTARINLFAPLLRLAGLGLIVAIGHPTLMAWAIVYAVTGAAAAAVSVYCILRQLGRPRFVRGHWRAEKREGFYFSAGLSAQTIYNDIDKTMLAQWGALSATGIYGAAYRLVDVAFIPVRALLAAAYPGFFRSGQKRIAGTLAHARQLLPRALLYSVATALGLFLFAPLLPRVLGSSFARSTEALRWLAVLPILKTLHYFAADSLTGAGFQGLRTAVQIAIAVFNIGANLWIIPLFSWRGVAWTSIGSDGLLALALWTCAALLLARDKSSSTTVHAAVLSNATND
jgi:O-antigen/teichoic acid export membrane protein